MSERLSAVSTPILTKESKKRELSSPEFDTDNKKNRLLSDSVSESDISGIEAENMAHMEAGEMSATATDTTGSSSHLTLRDEDLQKNCKLHERFLSDTSSGDNSGIPSADSHRNS